LTHPQPTDKSVQALSACKEGSIQVPSLLVEKGFRDEYENKSFDLIAFSPSTLLSQLTNGYFLCLLCERKIYFKNSFFNGLPFFI
jgi:hypothetical protein